MRIDLRSYYFDTLTGEGTLMGKFRDDDPGNEYLTEAHSQSQIMPGNRLKIWTDDGNQSSFGFDIWEFLDNGFVMLVEAKGFDCFDGNISDGFAEIEPGLLRIPVDEFDSMFKNHVQKWEQK